ncbi:hypothetical protein BASA81_012133 [Batrachochytrium salamandrivorans]|nr:hypothetical protein BASA81_012133 [Batrachochytrium salamandrivorans]
MFPSLQLLVLLLVVHLATMLYVAAMPTTTTTIVGAGASFPATLYQSLSFAFSSEYPELVMSYTALGSGKGKCRVVGSCSASDTAAPQQVDFAGSDSIHTPGDYAVAEDLQMYPAVAGAVVAAFNVPGVSALVLPVDVVADMFRQCAAGATCPAGSIALWNDSRIVGANPGVDAQALARAGRIRLVVRQESSGTTEIWKQALGSFSAGFAAQLAGQLTDSAEWPGVLPVYAKDNHGVASVVLNTPGALGYASLQEAVVSGNTYAALGRSVLSADGELHATSKSVMYALTERGFAFGNNGDLPQHLTAGVMGAQGSEAWPAAGFTYFSVRSNGTDCAQRRALLQWFEWFYQSAAVDAVAESLGFVTLPAEGKAFVLARIRGSLRCGGRLVRELQDAFPVAMPAESRTVAVSVAVNPELASTFLLYAQSYDAGANGVARVALEVVQATAQLRDADSALYVLGWRDSQAVSAARAGRRFVPFTAVPWGVVYNLCESSGKTPECLTQELDLVLSLPVLDRILRGEVEFWDAPEIAALQSSDAQRLLLPSARILFVGYAPGAREPGVFAELLAERGVAMQTGAASLVQPGAPNFQEASRLVFANRYSFTFGPVNAEAANPNARTARFAAQGAAPVAALGANLKACVGAPGAVFEQYALARGADPACWPLTDAHFLSLPGAFSSDLCATRVPQEATLFGAALLNAKTTPENDPLEALGFASLVDANKDAFDLLACYGRSIVRPVVDPQLVPLEMTVVFQVLAGLLILFALGMVAWIKYHRPHGVIRASTPVFLYQMCFGFALELSAIFPLSVQDTDGVSQASLDAACMAAPWLYAVGFALVYAGLLVKTWRISMLFNNPKMQKRTISNLLLFKLQVSFLVPIIVLLVVWTVFDPMVWTRSISALDQTTGEVVATVGVCGSPTSMYFVGPAIGYFIAFLIAGLVLAWKNRMTPTDFSEGRYVSAAIMTDSELLIIAIPVLVIVSAMPIASYVIKVMFILISVVSTIAIFFYPKFAVVHGYWAPDERSGSRLVSPVQEPMYPGQFNSKVTNDMSGAKGFFLSAESVYRSTTPKNTSKPGTRVTSQDDEGNHSGGENRKSPPAE